MPWLFISIDDSIHQTHAHDATDCAFENLGRWRKIVGDYALKLIGDLLA